MNAVGVDGGLGIRLGHLFAGHGDRCEVAQIGDANIFGSTRGAYSTSSVDDAVFDGWNALWEGFASMEAER